MGLSKESKVKFNSSNFNEEFRQTLFNSISIELLRGVVNIDGGHLGIATDWFLSCMECDQSYYESTCQKCGRNKTNYVDFRSGRGDGVYPVFTIYDPETETNENLGCLILFDFEVGLTSIGQIYTGMMNELQEFFSDASSLEEAFEEIMRSWDPIMQSYSQDLQIFEIAELELNKSKMLNHVNDIESFLVIGESGEGIDSDSALVTLLSLEEGKYKVFLAGSRDLENNNAFIPNLAIVLESNFSNKIGLNSDLIPKLYLSDEKKLWQNATVAAYFGNPQNQVAIFSNYNFFNSLRILSENEGIEFETQRAIAIGAVCWLSMLNLLNPNEEVKKLLDEFINHYEINSAEIHELRGQFNRKML